MARAASNDLPLLIPHVDDLGVSHGANLAFVELAGLGFVTCGSVMPPCSWFPEMVAMVKERPALDVGVHLTLTSESCACRWRPISTASRTSGLLDGDGFMWPDVPSLRHAAWRIDEYELLREPDFLAWVAAQPVQLGGFREIRDRYWLALAKA
jgi:predicted glycoside hydrolase/deacetylase ChbG (UPF0249 family)